MRGLSEGAPITLLEDIKEACEHDKIEIPSCVEYLCEEAPDRALVLLKQCGLTGFAFRMLARNHGIDVSTSLDFFQCLDVPGEYCSSNCPFYFQRRISEVLRRIETIYMYREEDDVIYEVWFDGAPFRIRASAFQKGVQALLLMAGEPVFLRLLGRKKMQKVLETVFEYFHKNAKKLSAKEAYKKGIALEGEEILDYVLEELRIFFFNEEFVRNEKSIDKPFIIDDKIYIAQDLLLKSRDITPKKLTRALSHYGIKTKQFRWGYSFFRAYEIPVRFFESLRAPIDKIVQAGREERERSEREAQEFLARVDRVIAPMGEDWIEDRAEEEDGAEESDHEVDERANGGDEL